MRVIAGSAKKRRLIAPPGLAVRPTADRVKEALFNILGGYVLESRFLDLFAGAGGVGIEALSRGAGQVVFVEKEPKNMEIIKKNLQLTGLSDKAGCLCLSAEKALELLALEDASFDLIFMDPPYRQNLVSGTLHCIAVNSLLSADGLVVVETGKEIPLPERENDGLSIVRREKYGDTLLAFYQYQ